MPQSPRLLALVPAHFLRTIASRLTPSPTALLALFLLLASVTSDAGAQPGAVPDTPLHLAANRFEFVASDIAQPSVKPLAVHNGGTARLTDVRLTRVAYADSSRGAAWLVAVPRQSVVAPDELATVGTLCVDPTGLKSGTYHATAAVDAREISAPVPITITLVVTDAGARARHAAARCGAAATK